MLLHSEAKLYSPLFRWTWSSPRKRPVASHVEQAIIIINRQLGCYDTKKAQMCLNSYTRAGICMTTLRISFFGRILIQIIKFSVAKVIFRAWNFLRTSIKFVDRKNICWSVSQSMCKQSIKETTRKDTPLSCLISLLPKKSAPWFVSLCWDFSREKLGPFRKTRLCRTSFHLFRSFCNFSLISRDNTNADKQIVV